MDVGFLCRVLENYDLSPFITGTTRGKMTKAGAEEILVPVPPLSEQRRIAAILDQTDDLRRKRQCTLEQLGRITDALLSSLLHDRQLPVEQCRLSEVAGLGRHSFVNGPFGSIS